MRPAYTIDLEHGCIFVKWSGIVTAHDIIAFNREIAQDPGYQLGLNQLVDLRRAKIEASSNEIRQIAGAVFKERDANEGHRKGAMLISGKADYGLMRMIDMMIEQTRSEMRPFRELDEAMAWLGLPETLGDSFETMNQG